MTGLPLKIRVALLFLLLAPPGALAQPQPTTLPPVIVEGARVTPERTRTEQESREEIERVPGGVDLIGQRKLEESHARMDAADESQISVRGLRSAQRLPPARAVDPHRRVSHRQTCAALSRALKAYMPDVTAGPNGEFVITWHEEQFPATKTVVQPVRAGASSP